MLNSLKIEIGTSDRRTIMDKAPRWNERRRVPRITVELAVTLTWERKSFPCQARQLSEFGILLACEHKELVGKDIQVRLKLDSPSRSLSLSGIVAYAIDNEIGVRFKDLSAEQQPVLKDYVEARQYNQPVV
jgi:hypothetical protein